MYCVNPFGGTHQGTLIEYDPVGNTITKKVNCSYPTGSHCRYQMTVYNGKMYGLGGGGIDNNSGVFFEYNPVPNSMQAKILFRQNDGMAPIGGVSYYNGKVFGISKEGGDHSDGVIWEYDLATYTYSARHHFNDNTPVFNQGMTVYNGQIFGCTESGGTNGDGTLFRFDPVNYTYTTLHNFDGSIDGASPRGRPIIINNKIYGTCSFQDTWGTIWEYNLANNTFALKVVFGQAGTWGHFPIASLTELNGNLWGVCFQGGLHDEGTIFQYFPAFNGITKRFDFEVGVSGGFPQGGLTAVNNKLYGVATSGSKLFEFDPASSTYTIKATLTDVGSSESKGKLLWNEKTEKFYGLTYFGGNSPGEGTLFEYDLPNDLLEKKVDFTPDIGNRPNYGALEKVPAHVAPGNPGNCVNGGSANVDATNNNEWIAFTNTEGDAVAEINANGNNLGRVLVNFYVHNGATRMDQSGRFYLNRNITITSDNPPVNPVSIRLYIRKTEFDALKNTPGSGIVQPADLAVFKNGDPCQAAISNNAFKLISSPGNWGGDYVYSTTSSSFSTFYFASNAFTVLPIKLLSFTGSKEPTANKLEWAATCTNDVDFLLERSTDGINFSPVKTIQATQQDCNHPFSYKDAGITDISYYYRLKMDEHTGPVTYSKIILLNRSKESFLQIKFVPNPVNGPTARLQVESSKQQTIQVSISDMTGRTVMQRSIQVQAGIATLEMDMSSLSSGVYNMSYSTGEKTQMIRFIKQ